MKNRYKTFWLFALALSLLAFAPSTPAQSTDQSNPTPITSSELIIAGPRKVNQDFYYSFTGGPGEVSMTFNLKAKTYSTFVGIKVFDAERNTLTYHNMSADTSSPGLATKKFDVGAKQTLVMSFNSDSSLGECKITFGGAVEFGAGKSSSSSEPSTSTEPSSGNKLPPPPSDKLPDLVVTGIVYAGDKAKIEIWNTGEAASQPCQLRFVVKGLPEQTVFADVPSLFPKGFVHTATISRIKGFMFEGEGVAKVDFDNRIIESDENNNEKWINQSAAIPDLAAVSISFKSEGNVGKVIGVIQNVSKIQYVALPGLGRKAVLVRIAKYGFHQWPLTVKEVPLPSINPGAIYELKAEMPAPFKGADSYLWILRIDGKDANASNDKVEKSLKKVDNNN